MLLALLNRIIHADDMRTSCARARVCADVRVQSDEEYSTIPQRTVPIGDPASCASGRATIKLRRYVRVHAEVDSNSSFGVCGCTTICVLLCVVLCFDARVNFLNGVVDGTRRHRRFCVGNSTSKAKGHGPRPCGVLFVEFHAFSVACCVFHKRGKNSGENRGST